MNAETKAGELVPFEDWLASIGKSRSTGWNYRKRKAIEVLNVFGSLYITREEIARFEARAKAGEFARKRKSVAKQPA